MSKKIILLFLFVIHLELVYSQINCDSMTREIENNSIWSRDLLDKIDLILTENCSPTNNRLVLLKRAKYRNEMRQFDLAIEDLLAARKIKDGVEVRLQLAGAYAALERYYDAYIEWSEFHKEALLENNIKNLMSSQVVLGNIYLQLGQLSSAKKVIAKVDVYSKKVNNDQGYQMVNNLLTAYWFKKGEIDSALYYLKKGEAFESISEINPMRTFNKGVIFLQIGDLDNSALYFERLLLEADKIENKAYVGMAKYGLSQIALENDRVKAFTLLKEALTIIKTEDPKLGVFICDCVLDNFSGDEYEALLPFFRNEQAELKESYNEMTEEQLTGLFETSAQSFEDLIKAKQDIYSEKNAREVTRNKNRILSFFLLFATIFTALLVIFILKMSKLKKKNEHLIREQNLNLNTITIRLIHLEMLNSEVINKLKKVALRLPSKATSESIYEIAAMLKSEVAGVQSSELNDLENLIQSINEGYLKKLCEKYPSLSSSELTMAIYIRMNLSTKQIADMKNIEANSVDVARSRLRKKLGLTGSNIDLTTYLNRL